MTWIALEFSDVIRRRRSIRAYTSTPVEEAKLKRIFEAANMAPSAGNLQAYQVHVVKDQAKRQALAKAAYDQEFITSAPVCLVFCADPARSAKRYGDRGKELYSIQDATIAGTYAMLAAADLGLATAWVGQFDDVKVQDVIGSKALRPVVMFSLGYPAEEPTPTGMRSIEDIFRGDFPQTD
jgi:nitroreductase